MSNKKYEWIAENVKFYNLTVKEPVHDKENVWNVNTEKEYHEQK